MPFTEPTTMITDYLVAGLSVTLWWRLLRSAQEKEVSAQRWWGRAFLATAVGAVAGGTSHGFTRYLSETGWLFLWKTTVYALGLASLCLLIGALRASFTGRLLNGLVALAWVKLVVYAFFMMRRNDFDYVIYDYGSSMLIVLALEIRAWLRQSRPSAPWIVAGIAVSFAAARIQMSGFSLHPHFDHDDLFHVVQMLGLWLLYRGGLVLTDAGTGPDPPPRYQRS